LGLFLFFVGIIFWVFRPGASQEYRDNADIPFRHADKPATNKEARS
jgi:cytochrome c oxidase cbb3-type subunit 4